MSTRIRLVLTTRAKEMLIVDLELKLAWRHGSSPISTHRLSKSALLKISEQLRKLKKKSK